MSEAKPGSGLEPNQAYSASKHAIQGAGENVHEAKEAVSKATASISNLLSGKGNMVDTALAVKGAVDNVAGLTGRLSATAMMPVMKALSAFKGQAVLPAGKQMDPVLGIDVHMVLIPPSPAPIPMPHPYIGILFNPKDWVSCLINTFKKDILDAVPAPAEGATGSVAAIASNKDAIASIAMGLAGMSASVKFGGFVPRAVTGTKVKNIPHIPMGAGFHPGFVAAVAKNHGKAFLGSLFVAADGDPMVGSFHLNYDCWDVGIVDLFKSQRAGAKKAPEAGGAQAELYVPSGTVLPIPWGRPVLVNSIPTPINPMAILDHLFKAGLGKLKAAGKKAVQKRLDNLNGKVGCGPLTAVSKAIGTGQSHPVDVSGGYFYTDNVDFSLPGPIPLSWERTWYSNSDYKGPLGYGWHHSYDMALAIDDETQKAILRMSDGRVATFDLPVSGKESYNRAEKLTLIYHEEGYYYVTNNKSLIYRFTVENCRNPINNTETHLLQSIANRNGFAIRFKYDKSASLVQMTDSGGRILLVNNDSNGRIINIQAPDPTFGGRTIYAITSYAYTKEGDMEKQADALDQPMCYYYEHHLMVKEIWRNGCNWHLKYDKMRGTDARCIEVSGTGDLLHYKFDYTDGQCTVVINSRGFKKLFCHKNGVVTKYVDALNSEWAYRYNQYNELEWETNPLGNQKATAYDEWGNAATVTEANGAFLQVTYGIGILKHLPIESTDKAGGKWKWEYDYVGNLMKHTNPIKAETEYEYLDGLLKCVTNAKGCKTFLEYDTNYNLTAVISSNGYEIHWNYDILGNSIKSSDSVGNNSRTKFNLLSLPEVISEPDGNVRYFKFDADGNVVYVKDKHYEIQFGYDLLNLLQFKAEGGHTVSYRRDTEGNLIQFINERNETYSFEIDATDSVIKETGFDGVTRSYIRDKAGNIIKINRAENKFTQYRYDEMGNITEVSYHDASFEKYGYSNDCLLIAAKNSHSDIGFERDISGRITRETINEHFINYQFDSLGNRIQISSSLGANIKNEYDDFENVIATKASGWESRSSYNELGLELERWMPGDINLQWHRDKLGRPTSQNIKNNTLLLNKRQYSWDISSRLRRIVDSQTGLTRFEHDETGNLAKTIFSDGMEQFRNPDTVGNLFKSLERTDRHYGKGGKLLNAVGTNYRYDSEGSLVEKTEAGGKTSKYLWNANGSLKSVTRPDGDIISFTYDALERRLSKRYKNTVTRWLWDGNKPLHEWKELESVNQQLNKVSINGDNIITWLFNENNFSPVAKLKCDKKYSIISDHLGTPYQMYNNNGEKFWEAQLDSYGKVRMCKGEHGSCPFRYQGQYEDVETGLYYNRFRYYDAEEGMYINQDPIGLTGGTKLYSYVSDTNIWVDVFGLKCLSEREKALPTALQKRPKWWKKTKKHLDENSPKDANGNFIDAKTGRPITGQKAIGHKDESWREYQDNPANHGKTREQVCKDYNNVDNLGYEDSSNNSSIGAKTKGLEN